MENALKQVQRSVSKEPQAETDASSELQEAANMLSRLQQETPPLTVPLVDPIALWRDVGGVAERDLEFAESKTTKRGRPFCVDTIVDISQLLQLSLKTAAAVMGVSESTLCRRFKEVASCKWPYRQMRKLKARIIQLKALLDGRTPELERELAGKLLAAQRELANYENMSFCIRFSNAEQLQLAKKKNLEGMPGIEIFQVDDADYALGKKKTVTSLGAASKQLQAPVMFRTTAAYDVEHVPILPA